MAQLTDRMSEHITMDRNPSVGTIFEFTQDTPGGTFTREYEIIARVPDTRIIIKFMCGFTRSCKWNDNHGGFRRATDEERETAQAWLDAKAKKLAN